MIRFENVLSLYFGDRELTAKGLPTVQYVAAQLNLSPHYLSDLLKSTTGQTTQQHIHNWVVEKAKTLLSTTSWSVSQIAYQLGFDYPSSLNKLFRNKVNIAPLEFRKRFSNN